MQVNDRILITSPTAIQVGSITYVEGDVIRDATPRQVRKLVEERGVGRLLPALLTVPMSEAAKDSE